MAEFTIKISIEKHPHVETGQVIKVTKEAYNAMVDIRNKCGRSAKYIASRLIIEAAKHVEYVEEED